MKSSGKRTKNEIVEQITYRLSGTEVWVMCGRCFGIGWITPYRDGVSTAAQRLCDHCDGTGQVDLNGQPVA